MKITLQNDYIMVRSLQRQIEEKISETGIIVPEANLDDEQVSSAQIVQGNKNSPELKEGDVIFFHKVMPVDVNMEWGPEDKKTIELFWFVSPKDIIFVVEQDK